MSSPVEINQDLCIGCGMCVQDCNFKHMGMRDGKVVFISDYCSECGHCFAICPQGAVSMADAADSGIVDVAAVDRITPDTILNNIKIRRSVRHFKPDPVDRDDVRKIIEAGRFTPTGSNRQKNRYLIVENPTDTIEQDGMKEFVRLQKTEGSALSKRFPYLNAEQPGSFFRYAPTVILVISTDTVDAALASTSMEFMAEAMGYGVVYVGLYVHAAAESSYLREILGLQEDEELVTAMAIGKPDVQYQRSAPRKKANIEWFKE